jgi:UDP-glucose 4-epimerase
MLIARSERLQQLLNWKPRYDDLDVIVKSALAWEQKTGATRA